MSRKAFYEKRRARLNPACFGFGMLFQQLQSGDSVRSGEIGFIFIFWF
jgi:hypothetical protein